MTMLTPVFDPIWIMLFAHSINWMSLFVAAVFIGRHVEQQYVVAFTFVLLM